MVLDAAMLGDALLVCYVFLHGGWCGQASLLLAVSYGLQQSGGG
jgi:hypothetical protein